MFSAMLAGLLVATTCIVMLSWHCVQEMEICVCLSLHGEMYVKVSAV